MSTITTILKNVNMDSFTIRLIAAGILFLLTLISGLILHGSGRPFSIGLITIHKLIAVGTIVLVGMAASQLYKTIDEKIFFEVIFMAISGVLFLTLIATGALLTREEMQLPDLVLKVHQIAPGLALVASSITVYLLARGSS